MYTMYTNSKTAADTRFIWYTWTFILMYTSCIPCIPTGARNSFSHSCDYSNRAGGYRSPREEKCTPPPFPAWSPIPKVRGAPLFRFSLVCVKAALHRFPVCWPARRERRGSDRRADRNRSRTARQFCSRIPFYRITPQNSLRADPFLFNARPCTPWPAFLSIADLAPFTVSTPESSQGARRARLAWFRHDWAQRKKHPSERKTEQFSRVPHGFDMQQPLL